MSEKTKQAEVDREIARLMKKHKDSLRSFTEQAIDNQLRSVKNITKGYSTLPTLINKLNNINRIDEPIPAMNLNIKLDNGKNVKTCNADIHGSQNKIIDDIADAADIDHSQVIRMCILFELEARTSESRLSETPDDKEIKHQAAFVRDELTRIESEFHETLHRLFTQCRKTTIYKIERSEHEFNRFAQTYAEDFYGTTLYSELIEKYGSDAFDATEEVITDEESNTYVF